MSKCVAPSVALKRVNVVQKNRRVGLKRRRGRQTSGLQLVCAYASMTASGEWTPNA